MSNSIPNNPTPSTETSLSPFSQRKVSRSSESSESLRLNIDVLGSLKRHWVIAISVFVVFLAAGGYVVIKKSKPVYSSHSEVYVSPKFPKLMSADSELDRPYDSYVQDEVHTVTRYDIIADAIEKLPWSVRHRSGPALPYEVQVLQHSLDVARIGNTYQVSIGLQGPKPDGLAETVNAITSVYLEKAKNEEFYGRDERLTTLNQEKNRLQKELDNQLGEQAQLMQDLGMARISGDEGQNNPYDTIIMKLRDQLATARIQREEAEAQMASVVKGGVGQSSTLEGAADEAISGDSSLSGTKNALSARRMALLAEISGLKPDHPLYQKNKEELASVDAQLNGLKLKATTRVQDKLRAEVARTRMIELQLGQELAEKTHSATSAAPKFQRAVDLGSEIERSQKEAAAIDERIHDIELETSSPGSIHLFSQALPPLEAEKSKLRTYLLALVCMCLVCGISAPIAIDLLDSRIYTASDVEHVVGFHPLGILLKDEDFGSELTAEYYFRLAAGIDHAVRTAGARTFIFTSLTQHSGTSTVVERLSEKLRGLELRTLTIVASDVNDPVIYSDDSHHRSDIVLHSRAKHEENAHTALVSIGESSESSRRWAGQETPAPNPVARAIHQAGKQYDVVLIDANPLLISAHTEYLARISDATVLIAESSAAKKQQLDRAARLLERLNVAGVAVVLNKVGLERADSALRDDLRQYEQTRGRQRRSADRPNTLRTYKPKAQTETGTKDEVESVVANSPSADPVTEGSDTAKTQAAV
jgi:polysaccharide biosynthesis transport protein